jgi:nitroreductase
MIPPSQMQQTVIERAVVERLLEAANWAPSHRLTEPWRFVVFAAAARQRLGEVFLAALLAKDPDADAYSRAKVAAKPLRSPIVIAVICQPSDLPKVKRHEEDLAVACAIQNMGLLATAYGLSLFWSTGSPTHHPLVGEFLGCRDDAAVIGFLHLGLAPQSGWPEGRRGAWEDKVVWCEDHQVQVPVWAPTQKG